MQNEQSGITLACDSLLDFLFPPLCLVCGEYESSRQLVCRTCDGKIDKFNQPFCLKCGAMLVDAVSCPDCHEKGIVLFAYGNYRPVLRDIIIHFKFRGITKAVPRCIHQLYRNFGPLLQQCRATCLLPIPLHPQRERQRGYNQALLIADELGTLLNLPVESELLFRVKKRKPQARLDWKQRVQNIRGVFSVADDEYPQQRVLLVDDVVTTGATVQEAATTLESAGHIVVGAVSLAHGV